MKRTFFTLIIFSFSLLCSYAQTNEQTDSVPDIQAAIRAANEGDVSAQCFLGIVYSVGQYNVEQNYTEAIKWFTMAAEQGEPTAQYNLSLFYIEGFGVKPDTVQAQKWYDLALQQRADLPPLIVERPATNDIDLTINTKKKGKSDKITSKTQNKFAKAIPTFRTRAEAGDAVAQREVRQMAHDAGRERTSPYYGVRFRQ